MKHPELYILRHGETVWNAENRMQGWLNSPLTAQGEAQAARQGVILRGRDLQGFAFLSSPSGRAFQTAGIAAGAMAAECHTDLRLREIGVGDWAGRLRHELPMSEGPDAFIKQYEDAPGGEGFDRLRARCTEFIVDLQGPAVIFTHGITSRMLRTILIGPDALTPAGVGGGQGVVYHLKNGAQTLLH